MKRLFTLIIIAISFVSSFAQETGNDYLKRAEDALAAKEYVKARYLYLKAYQSFAANSNIEAAIPCAINVAALYHRENYYSNGFEVLYTAERFLADQEETKGYKKPELHYNIDRERQRMYLKMRNNDRASDQLTKMKNWAQQANDSTLTVDLLSSSAQYYYMIGQVEKGDAAINSLIAFYKENSDLQKADECYKGLISMANSTNNPRLISRIYDKYISWNDSIAQAKVDQKTAELREQIEQAHEDIEERNESLSIKNGLIYAIGGLAAILAGGLLFVTILLLRYIAICSRQKKQITTLQSHNELKTRFISNITNQMQPTLDTLPQNLPAVKALHTFVGHIQELSDLESSLTEIYPTEGTDVTAFCTDLTNKMKANFKPDVKLVVDTPKIEAPLSVEPLAHVLNHLLYNSALHTESGGKICLEVKKRGPHNIQFIITDTGSGIDPEKVSDLFTPFAKVRDLTKGDGLGLPICSLLAIKMKGSLRLDETYTNGTRFILELRP